MLRLVESFREGIEQLGLSFGSNELGLDRIEAIGRVVSPSGDAQTNSLLEDCVSEPCQGSDRTSLKFPSHRALRAAAYRTTQSLAQLGPVSLVVGLRPRRCSSRVGRRYNLRRRRRADSPSGTRHLESMKKDETRITAIQRAGVLAGSRGRRGRAFLARISGRESGRVYALTASEAVIGRSSSSDIVIREDGVSRKHAKIVRDEDGTAKVIDLESTNGTYVNGLRVEVEALREGDQLRVGLTATFEFRYEYLPKDEDGDGLRPPDDWSSSVVARSRSSAASSHYAEAIEAYRQTLESRQKTYGEAHPVVAAVLVKLGAAQRSARQLDDALASLGRALSIYEAEVGNGSGSSEMADVLVVMGQCHLDRADAAEALPLLERALGILEGRRSGDHELATVRFALAKALRGTGREPLRARSLAQLARDGFALVEETSVRVADVDAWLLAHDA